LELKAPSEINLLKISSSFLILIRVIIFFTTKVHNLRDSGNTKKRLVAGRLLLVARC
jgi:hypothetical protein